MRPATSPARPTRPSPRSVPGHDPAVDADGPRDERGRRRPRATLSWTASTDNVGVTGYRVFRGGTQVGTPSATSYSFTGLTCGTTYTLGVAAVDAAGNVSGTATKTRHHRRLPGHHRPVDADRPRDERGRPDLASRCRWTASTDNVGVTGYRVFRDGTQVGTPAATSFAFSGLTCGTTYTLGVAAVDAAGNVSGTATTTVTTAACPRHDGAVDADGPRDERGRRRRRRRCPGRPRPTTSPSPATGSFRGAIAGRDRRAPRATPSPGSPAGRRYTLGVAAVDAAEQRVRQPRRRR